MRGTFYIGPSGCRETVGDMAFLSGGLAPFQFEPIASFLALACFLVVAALLVFIFVAIWMYKDAEGRGMSGGLWVVLLLLASFLFSFIGGLIVLVIYLIVRMERPHGVYSAGYAYGYGAYPPMYPPSPYPPPVPPTAAPAAPAAPAPSRQPTNCKSCGAPLAPNASFCSSCGSKV